ncbi:MAG: cysteine-rich CWC family protein [Pseudomonadota bacterium]
MTAALSMPDPVLCPLCGQANRCAMEVERETGVRQPPCWCTQASFSAELLSRIPPASRNKACICAACAASAATPA